ncbi:MAG: ABC transporter permease, partial [Elusimicrobia bacterium]|nr:ABC transporter permease [Elusimicrobiota bacterium]
MLFSLKIAWAYYRRIWSRGLLGVMMLISVLGIALGVTSLVITLSVMNGFHTEITDRLLSFNPHITVMNPLSLNDCETRVAELLEGYPGVKSVSGFMYAKGLLHKRGRSHGVVIKGVEPEYSTQDLLRGNWNDLSDRGMVLGAELADNLNLTLGDKALIVIPSMDTISSPMIPRVEEFRVAGIFSSGMHEYDSGVIYSDLNDSEVFKEEVVSEGSEIYISDPYTPGELVNYLEGKLKGPYVVQTWQERNYNLFAALKLEKTMMFIVLLMVIIVAMFNVAGSLIMVSVTRSKDCGIMRAAGATKKQIRQLFSFLGMFAGLTGAFLGTIGGLILAYLLSKYQFIELPPQVYMISTLPVKVSLIDILIVFSSALIISYIATLYP